ncbi:hypothetical protein ACQ4M4_24765 [Leptolyngbya sp. AN02str]|uniref:hypothetical protein n=1 Tax=Leptolyngbya sp. AN02str TaxID=3423363 RepID=UPI003D324179
MQQHWHYGMMGAIALVVGSAVALLPSRIQAQITRSSTIFESVTLSNNFRPNPTTLHGISGGPVSASQLAQRSTTPTGPCLGFVDRLPDHQLELTQPFDFLSVRVQSPEDTTLIIQGPGGVWCNDSYLDFNPGIAGGWLPGVYQIWVGSTRANRYHPYIIRLSQTGAPSAQARP